MRVKIVLLQCLVFLLPVVAALKLADWAVQTQFLSQYWEPPLQEYRVDNVAEALALFDRLGYRWPPHPEDGVPRVGFKNLPVDLADVPDVGLRKSIFIRMLLPMALAENERIRAQREFVLATRGKTWVEMTPAERRLLDYLLKRYKIRDRGGLDGKLDRLLLRLDEIPVSLVLAQAISESGWGTSRFAQQANNVFGVWTYKTGAGLVPKARDDGTRHAVRVFETLRAGVRYYLFNLNVGHAYEVLRDIRADMRAGQRPLDTAVLIHGLERYSERGEAYIRELQRIIQANQLGLFDGQKLRPAELQLGRLAVSFRARAARDG